MTRRVAACAAIVIGAVLPICAAELTHRWSFNGDCSDSVGGVDAVKCGTYVSLYGVGFTWAMERVRMAPAMSKRFFAGVAGFGNEQWATLVYELGQVAIEWFVLFWLYRKKTFLKI